MPLLVPNPLVSYDSYSFFLFMLSVVYFVKSCWLFSINVMSTVSSHRKLIQGEPGPHISPRLLIQTFLSPSFFQYIFSVYLTWNVTKTIKSVKWKWLLELRRPSLKTYTSTLHNLFILVNHSYKHFSVLWVLPKSERTFKNSWKFWSFSTICIISTVNQFFSHLKDTKITE